MKNFIISTALLLYLGSAQATVWEITGLLHGNTDGFGYSSTHYIDNLKNPMGGEIRDVLDSAYGTYNNVSGSFWVNFDAQNYNDGRHVRYDLQGTMKFENHIEIFSEDMVGMAGDMDYVLTANYLSYVSDMEISIDDGYIDDYDEFIVEPGKVCCGDSVVGPNLFATFGDKAAMAIWGYAPNGQLGMDFVITMDKVNPVPVPGAIWLMGTGLLGLIAKRKALKII